VPRSIPTIFAHDKTPEGLKPLPYKRLLLNVYYQIPNVRAAIQQVVSFAMTCLRDAASPCSAASHSAPRFATARRVDELFLNPSRRIEA